MSTTTEAPTITTTTPTPQNCLDIFGSINLILQDLELLNKIKSNVSTQIKNATMQIDAEKRNITIQENIIKKANISLNNIEKNKQQNRKKILDCAAERNNCYSNCKKYSRFLGKNCSNNCNLTSNIGCVPLNYFGYNIYDPYRKYIDYANFKQATDYTHYYNLEIRKANEEIKKTNIKINQITDFKNGSVAYLEVVNSDIISKKNDHVNEVNNCISSSCGCTPV